MTDSQERQRQWPRIGLRFLLAIPVAFALLFYVILERIRVPPEQRRSVEYKWVRDPLKARFYPAEDSQVRPGDPILKVARIITSRSAHSWLVMDGGIIRDDWYYGFDAGGNDEMPPANPEGLARLPRYLKRLPPSDLAANSPNSLIIAFPSAGVWVVRRYRLDAVPKEADDIAKALAIHSSFDGEAIDHWGSH